jgi:hypothetical protein
MTTWTPKTTQAEVWSELAMPPVVFDPHVFDLRPIFDTGFTSQLWEEKTKDQEAWVVS